MAKMPLNFGIGGGGSDEVTATIAQVLAGFTAITSDSDDEPVEGTIPTKSAEVFNISASDRTIALNQYLSGAQIIKGVTTENILAENIKKGVNVKVGDTNNAGRIKNITGTYTTPSSGQSAATANKILSGYSGFVNGGNEIKGSIASQAGKTEYATTSDKTIVESGKYCSDAIKVGALSQSGLASANIVRGKTISINNGSTNVFSATGDSSNLKMISGSINSGSTNIGYKYYDHVNNIDNGGRGTYYATFYKQDIARSITPLYVLTIYNGDSGGYTIYNYSTSEIYRFGMNSCLHGYLDSVLSSSYISILMPYQNASYNYYVFGY